MCYSKLKATRFGCTRQTSSGFTFQNISVHNLPGGDTTSYTSEHQWGQSAKSSMRDLLKIPTALHVVPLFVANKNIYPCKTLTYHGYKTVEQYNVLIRNSLICPCGKHIIDIAINLNMLVRKIKGVQFSSDASALGVSLYPVSANRDKTFIRKKNQLS